MGTTKPELFIVATPVLDDNHGVTAAAVGDPVKVVVCPGHTDKVPEIVGRGFTVKVAVTRQLLVLVYVMVVVPAATAVTSPVLLIVATPELDDTHGLTAAAVADPVSWDVKPIHAFNVPEVVGKGFTVKVAVILQLLLFV